MRKKRWLRSYARCLSCGGVALLPDFFASGQEQLARYSLHRNSLEDKGYRDFLLDFLFSVFSFPCVRERFRAEGIAGVADYGSGPEPALVALLRMVSALQRGVEMNAARLPCGHDALSFIADDDRVRSFPDLPDEGRILGWDSFFGNRRALPSGGAELVLCLEVAEHFERPSESFRDLARICAGRGLVAVGTLPLPRGMKFPGEFCGWWYKDDLTHVAFYTEAAARSCGERAGLEYMGMASGRIFVFRKP